MSDEKQGTTADTGMLVEGNVLACGAGMSEQNRQDVMNAFHFATLAADKNFNVEDDGSSWYNEFLEAMKIVGFVISNRRFERETSSEASLVVGTVALRAIGVAGEALLGGTVLADLAKKAFEALSVIESDARVLEHKYKNKSSGMVGMASCTEKDGQVQMVMSCVHASNPDVDEDLLGVQLKVGSSAYYSGTAVLRLNKSVNTSIRDAVETKLIETSVAKVLQYDI